ncbi:MAG: hypothetical protein ACXQS7_02390 [Candidatus Syntropharchaeia archaeon]
MFAFIKSINEDKITDVQIAGFLVSHAVPVEDLPRST